MPFKFEKLVVWQISIELATGMNALTRKFPVHEKYVLTPQLQKAADSVAFNLAEGSTGQTDPEFKRFLAYSIRSGIEVVCGLYLGKHRNVINKEDFDNLYTKYDDLIRRIQALRNSIKH
jgi:four helix bundle protein